MSGLKQMLDESVDIRDFSKRYFEYLSRLMQMVDTDAIRSFAEELEKAREGGNTVFLVGNGGSAATASPMANDLGPDIQKKTKTPLPFRAMSLTDNAAVMLSIANDNGYENLFINQLRIHYRKGDKLVAISASGNSSNVVNAARWVKDQGGVVLSMAGFDGGKLKEISDVVIHIKAESGDYGPVEDIHLIMEHLLVNWLQYQVETKRI